MNRDPKGRFLSTHNMSQSSEYGIWSNMLYRCNNPNCPIYKNYGAKGTKVCERWGSFELFIEDMGNRPSVLHSIDRIDVLGDYEPSNCRWATKKQQGRNRRNNVKFNIDGNDLTVPEIAEKFNISKNAISKRLQRGQSMNHILKALLC